MKSIPWWTGCYAPAIWGCPDGPAPRRCKTPFPAGAPFPIRVITHGLSVVASEPPAARCSASAAAAVAASLLAAPRPAVPDGLVILRTPMPRPLARPSRGARYLEVPPAAGADTGCPGAARVPRLPRCSVKAWPRPLGVVDGDGKPN